MRKKIIVQKNAQGVSTFRAPIPKSYIRSIGVSDSIRDINIELNNNKIVISKTEVNNNEENYCRNKRETDN